MSKYTDTDLHLAGTDCERKRLAMHLRELDLQADTTIATDAAYYDAVAALVVAEEHYYAVEMALGYART